MSSHICSPKAITHLGRNLLHIFHLVYTPIGKSLFFHDLNCSCTIQELVIFCAYKSSNSCKKGTLQVSLPPWRLDSADRQPINKRLNQKILGCILDTLQTLAAHIRVRVECTFILHSWCSCNSQRIWKFTSNSVHAPLQFFFQFADVPGINTTQSMRIA